MPAQTSTSRDTTLMALALRLAAKGRGFTSPNPMVGAVVVAGGRVVGRGYHARLGGPHAEVAALHQAGRRAIGATLYVSLEPCSHIRKRTPPCVPLVVRSGIRRVVVATRDPNPQVSSRGLHALRAAGLQVDVGCLGEQAESLNAAYFHWQRTGRPLVILKAGMTLDGKIATAEGESQWITGEKARRDAHRLRSQVDAVMVGLATVRRDNPQLTARLSRTIRQPLRVIVDSLARIPVSAGLLSSGLRGGTLVAVTDRAPKRRVERLQKLGVNIVTLKARNGQVPLASLLATLGRLAITSVLIEGGSELNASAIGDELVDRVVFYVAPRLLGGQDAKGVIGGRSPVRLAEAVSLSEVTIRRLGSDLLIEGAVRKSLSTVRPRKRRWSTSSVGTRN